MPADCQIDSCGVLAIGRCTECQTAFCASHAGHGDIVRVDILGGAATRPVVRVPRLDRWSGRRTGECGPCARRRIDASAELKRAEKQLSDLSLLKVITQQMVASGRPGTQPRRKTVTETVEMRPAGLFRAARTEQREREITIQPRWPLGTAYCEFRGKEITRRHATVSVGADGQLDRTLYGSGEHHHVLVRMLVQQAAHLGVTLRLDPDVQKALDLLGPVSGKWSPQDPP